MFLADGRCGDAGACSPSLESKDPRQLQKELVPPEAAEGLWGGQAAPHLDSKAQAATSLPWTGNPRSVRETLMSVTKLAEM